MKRFILAANRAGYQKKMMICNCAWRIGIRIEVKSCSIFRADTQMLRATLVYIFVGLYIVLVAPFTMFWTLLARNARLFYRWARVCIRAAGWISGTRLNVEGTDKILPGKTYVFLSNHLGNFDGPVLSVVIPRDLRALMKQEMMQIPILSWVLKQVQFIPIDRRNSQKAQESIDLGADRLRQGLSFFAFPEGTRSRTGKLGEFKKGVFIMAIKAQVPIIPVTILGTDRIQPPGKYNIRPGTVRVIFHDPISTEGMTLEDRNRLIQLTRNAIASRLPA
jgi:1-acyl-sn-glycerol-3-phosphate acyltransferase